jgi:chromatin segregation and condensation protein Rec8/ScpA/Scc1 (kleisin family)
VQQATLETYMDDGGPVEIPMLELRSRIPPKRRVTLDELVGALEKVFADQKARDERPPVPVIVPAALEIKLAEFNMDDRIGQVQTKISRRLDKEGLVTFSALLDNPSREETVFTLLPLLFLTQSGITSMAQDPFFGEIFIRLLPPQEAKEKSMRMDGKSEKTAREEEAGMKKEEMAHKEAATLRQETAPRKEVAIKPSVG